MSDVANIEGRIDREVAGEIEISRSEGGIALRTGAEMMEFAKMMSVAKGAVPKHLRGEPGMCLAVCVQATNWRMDPFAVANKSYFVSDRIAFEAQLVQAVIEQRAPIKGRIEGEYTGEGQTRQCHLRVELIENGKEITYISPEIGKIKTKNSPLWTADPDQQLWYYSARAMCRRHFPDVLLGVYAQDELAGPARMRDVTPEVGEGTARLQKLMEQQRAGDHDDGRDVVDPPEPVPETPDVEDAEIAEDPEHAAHKEGMKAVQDFGPSANPPEEYAEGSEELAQWMHGFRAQMQADAAEENKGDQTNE